MPVAGAAAAARGRWGGRSTLSGGCRGLRFSATDIDWQVGVGPLVEAPIASLLLLVTGRPGGLAPLTGPGVPEARRRFSADAGVGLA